MTARANWHLAELAIDQSDPFGDPPPVDVREEGALVDLTDPEFLRGRLVDLLLREGELDNQGIACSIKDHPDTCCSACPLRGSAKAHRIRELCKLGTEQERTVMAIRVVDA